MYYKTILLSAKNWKSSVQNILLFRNPFFLPAALLLLLPQLSLAQGGCTGFGSSNTEEAFDIVETSGGSVFVAGKSDQNSGDAYLMKFKHGNSYKEWDQTYGTNSKKESAKALTLHNGALYLAGFTKKDGDKDVLLLKIDTATGAVKNNRYLGNSDLDAALDIIVTKSGNLAITGRTKTTSGQNSILTFVMEFTMSNSSFNIKREFAYGTGNTNNAYALEQDSQGDYWVAGKETNNSGLGIIYQLTNNFSNNTSADVIYKAALNDGSNNQSANDIEADGNDMVVTGTGKFQGTSLSAKSAFALKLSQTTSNPSSAAKPANKIKEFGTGNTEKSKAISVSSKNYVFTGESGNDKMFSFKTKSDLSSVTWSLESGGSSTDYGNAVTETNFGAFMSVGKSQSSPYSSGAGNFYLMQTNSGTNCCSKTTSISVKSLNASNLLSDDPENSDFSMDKAKLANHVKTINNPQTSNVNGTMNNSGACGALPVAFTGFNLEKRKPNKIQISWETASETNNDYFTILRNFEGKGFKPVAKVQGQGTKTIPTHYSQEDKVNKAGHYYYKIRQTDFDGSQSTSAVKSIRVKNGNELSIDKVRLNNSSIKVNLSDVRSKNRLLIVTGISGKPLGRKKLQSIKGQQTVRFQGTDLKNRMLYLRVINTRDGSKVKGRKVIGMQ